MDNNKLSFGKEYNLAPFWSFTFWVWVKSVLVIVIGLGVILLFSSPQLLSHFNIGYIIGAFGRGIVFTCLAYIFTIPGFIIMLIAVYLINRTKLKIGEQKLLIFFIYALPFLYFGVSGEVSDNGEFLMFGFLAIVPAIMIYITPLLPYNQLTSTKEERADLIDDFNFEE